MTEPTNGLAMSDKSRTHPHRVPRSWKEWAYFFGEPAVSGQGSDVFEWAVETLRDFYSDEWFNASIERFDCPVMNMWDAALRNPSAVVRLIERACRIGLLSDENRSVLRPPASLSSDGFFHLDLILEVHGLAVRDGWQVVADQELETSRKPDLTVSKLGRRFLLEITIQGKSRAVRDSERFSDALSSISFATERQFAVVTHTDAAAVVSDSEVAEWQSELDRSAALVAADGSSREIDVNGIRTTIVPEGTSGRTYDGPLVAEDAWRRFATRLLEKAEQTAGGPHAWIRIDEVGGLILMTAIRQLQPHQQLQALRHNLEITLEPFPHIDGVVIGMGAGPDWGVRAPEFTYFDEPDRGWAAPTVFDRLLPGSRRRRTFVVPLSSGKRLMLPPGPELLIGSWYSGEGTWLEWALDRLEQPPLHLIVASRK